eukprot:59811_1
MFWIMLLTNVWTAGTGILMCFVIMFLMNWVYGLVAWVIFGLLFAYVHWKDPEVDWGSARHLRKCEYIRNPLVVIIPIGKYDGGDDDISDQGDNADLDKVYLMNLPVDLDKVMRETMQIWTK